MGFRENLKAQLLYIDMSVKQLAELSGVKKRTLDTYLDAHENMPPANTAVKIAGVLGVTVEHLVTGEDAPQKDRALAGLPPDLRGLVQTVETLDRDDRTVVAGVANLLKERRGRR
jgi:transcriptional regulator with XRE-family HTH domain